MAFLRINKTDGVAVIALERGKVNALNELLIDNLKGAFEEIEQDDSVRAVVMTGRGYFFSFGFDVPEFLDCKKADFMRFLGKFTDLYKELFIFPKPLLAALNGHAIAGGCMLALACDERFMVPGKAKISLNEIRFGSSVFAGSVEMLRFCTSRKNAQAILYSGDMFTAEEALQLGLIDRIVPEDIFLDECIARASELGEKQSAAFRIIKKLLRQPVVDEMAKREEASIREFTEVWYSDKTRDFLRKIIING
jgi:3,2-trans-enoyl-CoA isomerase